MSEIPDLAISTEKVAAILAKARQFDVKDVVTDPDPGSNASDDAMLSVLEDHADDPVWSELVALIRGLNEDWKNRFQNLAIHRRSSNSRSRFSSR